MDCAMEQDHACTLALPRQQANILNSLFKDTKFKDVALFGGQQTGEVLQPVRAHKLVLAASSEFFSTLFESNDSNKSEYKLGRVSHESLELMVKVLYQGKVTDKRIVSDVQFACDILEGAKYLLMEDLALACENILIKQHLTVMNCIYLWNIACKYPNLPSLTAEVEHFLATSLPEVMLEESFLRMEPDEICRMMRINLIETSTSPDERFQAAFAWLEYDAYARRRFSSDILSTIPFTPGKISRQALIKASYSKAVTEDATRTILELLANSLTVAEFLVDPDFIAQASPAVSSSCFSSAQTDANALFCITGKFIGKETLFQKFDVRSRTWRRLKSLPRQQRFGAACMVRGRVMLYGGLGNGKSSSSVCEYEGFFEGLQSWYCGLDEKYTGQTGRLPYASSRWLACGFRDTAYVCARNKDFFQYIPVADYLQTKSFMDVDRYGKSIALSPAFSAAVYAAGGRGEYSETPKREIEKYDIYNDVWQTVGLAASDRFNLSSAICGDDLYLIAGDDDGDRTVEKFNIYKGKSYAVPDMGSERRNSQAAMLYNNVICVFGDDHKSVEAYDVREGKWSVGVIVPDMPFAVSGCCVTCK